MYTLASNIGLRSYRGGTLLFLCAIVCICIVNTRTHADVCWYYGQNTLTNLETQTSQSSGGQGLQVTWKDSVIKPTDPTQIGGERTDISVIQYQPVPPLQTHALFSFNDVFGTGVNQLPTYTTISNASLWVNVFQVASDQTITIRGINWGDRDWQEDQASFAEKNEGSSTAWFGGGDFDGTLTGSYGTFGNPSGTNWFEIDVTAAVEAYLAGNIGGIALVSSSSPGGEIRNFYCSSDEADNGLQPGLFISYAIPEPMGVGLFMLGIITTLFIKRRKLLRRLSAFFLAIFLVITAGGSLFAEQVWIYGGNTVKALESQTGVSSSGRGQAVDWKDVEVKASRETQSCGDWFLAGIIQPQICPPLSGHVVFSFNDLFGITENRIPPSSEINNARLWVYVFQAAGGQCIRVCGVVPEDRDWAEQHASYLMKDVLMEESWQSGNIESGFIKEYGVFESPRSSGWFEIPLNLDQAVADYRDGVIGGIALVAESTTTDAMNNLYVCTDEYPEAYRRPGLFVEYEHVSTEPSFIRGYLVDAGDGSVCLCLDAHMANAIELAGHAGTYVFGGQWSVLLQLPDEGDIITELIVENDAGRIVKDCVVGSRFVDISQMMAVNGELDMRWDTSEDGVYTVFTSDTLIDPRWVVDQQHVSIPGDGVELNAETPAEAGMQFFRVRERTWHLANE